MLRIVVITVAILAVGIYAGMRFERLRTPPPALASAPRPRPADDPPADELPDLTELLMPVPDDPPLRRFFGLAIVLIALLIAGFFAWVS